MLPLGEEAGQHLVLDRFDLFAECGERASPQHTQHVVVAPFALDAVGSELASDDSALALEFVEPSPGTIGFEAIPTGDLFGEKGCVSSGVASEQVTQRIVDRVGEGLWQPGRERHSQGISKP